MIDYTLKFLLVVALLLTGIGTGMLLISVSILAIPFIPILALVSELDGKKLKYRDTTFSFGTSNDNTPT